MNRLSATGRLLALSMVFFVCQGLMAQDSRPAGSSDAVTVPEPDSASIATFRDHVSWLASPFLKGRLPGTPEMEIARDYIEYWFKKAGLKPVWGGDSTETIAQGADSYRQPFRFGGRRTISKAQVSRADGKASFAMGEGMRAMSMGSAGSAEGDLLFLGYGITSRGKDGYRSFEESDDLKGKVAMVFLYEPMNESGTSRWSEQRWSRASSVFGKSRGLRGRECAGIIFVIPPGVQDRAANLKSVRDARRDIFGCPVVVMTADAADKLIKGADPQGRSLMDLRKAVDEAPLVVPMKARVKINVEVTVSGQKMAENVGGLIPGRGNLAREVIVLGAHIDHLGLGYFGSRAPGKRGTIHPGADDNASGAAALIMISERLVRYYASLPEGAEARSVLVIGFDAEEQGLHGARHYTRAPLVPLDRHALMINFDMIGRITDHQIRMDGANSGVGLEDIIDPVVSASTLVIKKGKNIMMASDHAAFYSARVPILFSIITPFHDDYHTPEDTAAKINAEDGARVVELYAEIIKRVARHPEPIPFQRPGSRP